MIVPSQRSRLSVLLVVLLGGERCTSFEFHPHRPKTMIGTDEGTSSRRNALGWMIGAMVAAPSQAVWAAAAVQDSMNVDNFLRTGMDIGGNMGVSSQAGKSRPETGVFLRDGSEISRDTRTGDVLAEIILKQRNDSPMAVLVTYSSPWPLAKGSFFDVECRDAKKGDGAFLAATTKIGDSSGKISQLSDAFLLDNLLAPTGRFSFYGPPTDVKVKKSVVDGDYKVIDLSFSTLSQSTQTEIPRKARLVATIPEGSAQAVMLVGSASTTRWNKGASQDILATTSSFRAIPAPKTSMKLRRKERVTTLVEDE